MYKQTFSSTMNGQQLINKELLEINHQRITNNQGETWDEHDKAMKNCAAAECIILCKHKKVKIFDQPFYIAKKDEMLPHKIVNCLNTTDWN